MTKNKFVENSDILCVLLNTYWIWKEYPTLSLRFEFENLNICAYVCSSFLIYGKYISHIGTDLDSFDQLLINTLDIKERLWPSFVPSHCVQTCRGVLTNTRPEDEAGFAFIYLYPVNIVSEDQSTEAHRLPLSAEAHYWACLTTWACPTTQPAYILSDYLLLDYLSLPWLMASTWLLSLTTGASLTVAAC